MADVFCSEDVDEYVQKDCGIDNGGIIAAGFIDPSYELWVDDVPVVADLESEAWWEDLLSETPKVVFIATKTRGEYNGGQPTKEQGFGKSQEQVTGANHVLPLEFEGLEENRNFVEGINRRNWKIVFVTSGGLLHFVNTPGKAYFSEKIPKATNAGAFWGGEITWQDYSNPVICQAPDNIFEE